MYDNRCLMECVGVKGLPGWQKDDDCVAKPDKLDQREQGLKDEKTRICTKNCLKNHADTIDSSEEV